MMIFGWLVVAVAIVFGAKLFQGESWGRNVPMRSDRGQAALDILQERYAQGELSESEFLAMKANLQH